MKTTKYCLWVVYRCYQQIQDGGQIPSCKTIHNDVMVILTKFVVIVHLGPLVTHQPIKFEIFSNSRCTATILEIEISPHLDYGLIDHYEMWHSDTD